MSVASLVARLLGVRPVVDWQAAAREAERAVRRLLDKDLARRDAATLSHAVAVAVRAAIDLRRMEALGEADTPAYQGAGARRDAALHRIALLRVIRRGEMLAAAAKAVDAAAKRAVDAALRAALEVLP